MRGGPVGGDLAGDVDVVLDGDRDAQQRQPLPRVQTLLRGRGLLAGGSSEHHAVGPHFGIQPRDAFQVELGERGRGHRARGQQTGLFGGPGEGQLDGVHW